MKRATICLSVFAILAFISPVIAAPPPPSHYVFSPRAICQNPYAEKRRPQPHDILAIDAVLQPVDLPDYDLDPALSGDALTPQLRGMGAVDAHKVMYWAQDLHTRPLTVYNIVVVFWDVDGARRYMHHLADKCIELDGETILMPPMADETNACRRPGGMKNIYTINNRHGNVVSGIGVDSMFDRALEIATLSLTRVRREIEWN